MLKEELWNTKNALIIFFHYSRSEREFELKIIILTLSNGEETWLQETRVKMQH